MFVLFVAHRLGDCFVIRLAVTIPVNIPDFTGVPLSDSGSLRLLGFMYFARRKKLNWM